MKQRNTLISLLLLLCLSMFSNAQSIVKINILSPIVRTLNVQYEQKINSTSSFQLGLFYTSYSDKSTDLKTTFRGFGITPEYRFYLSESEAPQGVYVAPFIRYQNFKVEADDEFANTTSEAKFNSFGGGLLLGKQWIFKEKVALDLFFGPQYNAGNLDVDDPDGDFDVDVFDGFGLRAGVCFGIAF